MHIETENRAGALVIEPRVAYLDASNSLEFKTFVHARLTDGLTVVVDFKNVAFMDSSGLGALISLLRAAHTLGGDIKLVSLQDQVRSTMHLVRMHRVFHILNDMNELERVLALDPMVAPSTAAAQA